MYCWVWVEHEYCNDIYEATGDNVTFDEVKLDNLKRYLTFGGILVYYYKIKSTFGGILVYYYKMKSTVNINV